MFIQLFHFVKVNIYQHSFPPLTACCVQGPPVLPPASFESPKQEEQRPN